METKVIAISDDIIISLVGTRNVLFLSLVCKRVKRFLQDKLILSTDQT